MCYGIPSTEIFLILRYQHITKQIKQNLTCKRDILQARDCKGGNTESTIIIKIDFTFTLQLVCPVTIEISGWPYELL